MRFWLLLRSPLGFVPLALAVVLSLRVEALWLTDDPFEMFLPVVLWVILLGSWMVRHSQRHRKETRLLRRDWALPLCAAFVVLCGITQVPLRVVFWKQKAALQAAQKQLPFKAGKKFRFGGQSPFQVAESKGDTRFLLWHTKTWSQNVATGFAYCPGDAGCGKARFQGCWRFNDGALLYVPAPPNEFYWDYANGSTEYVSLGDNWYATKVSAEDVGDAGD